jgi:type IV secretion system protein VirB5
MRCFRSKKQIALAVAPGGYSEDDPEKITFDNGARLRVEANHWKMFCLILVVIATGAVYSRNPPPSVVNAYWSVFRRKRACRLLNCTES